MSEENLNDKSWFERAKDGLKEQIEIAKTIGAVGQMGVTMASGIAMEKPNVEVEQQRSVPIVQVEKSKYPDLEKFNDAKDRKEREEELEKSAIAGNQPTISGPPNADSLTQVEEEESSEEDNALPSWNADAMAKAIGVELQDEMPSEEESPGQSEEESEEEFEDQSQ